jgi:hypothetical protein
MATSGDGLAFSGSMDAFTVAPPTPPRIIISSENGTPLVTIHPNGTLEYGPGYSPDEAARRFWDAMRVYMPTRCGHVPGQQVD